MILSDLAVTSAELEAGTGWAVKPEGACSGELCVPLPAAARRDDGRLDVTVVAERLGMGIAHDDERALWAVGPSSAPSGRALTSARAPDVELPDVDGHPFRLSSLLGRKVLLVAWASW